MKVSTADLTPAHAYPVAGVSYSYTDSAVPFAVTFTVPTLFGQRQGFRLPPKIRETSAVSFVAQRQRLIIPCRTRVTAWQILCIGYGSHLCHLPFSFTSRSLPWTVSLPCCLFLNVIGNIFLEFVLSFEFLLHCHKYILTPYKLFAQRRTKTRYKKHLPEGKCCCCCMRKETHYLEGSTEFFEFFLHIF